MMQSSNNFFEIFGIAESYSVDIQGLSSRYRELQQQFHPDRFADKPERECHRAVQWSATINQAFDTLKSPLKRAQYLLSQQGLDSTGDSTITSDPGFLMEQMELRESLGEVRANPDPFALLDALRSKASNQYRQLQQEFAELHEVGQYDASLDTVAKMQFFTKLLAEIDSLEEELDE